MFFLVLLANLWWSIEGGKSAQFSGPPGPVGPFPRKDPLTGSAKLWTECAVLSSIPPNLLNHLCSKAQLDPSCHPGLPGRQAAT